MKNKVLFKTVHGSRLYGLSHENSDYDYYTVVDKVKNSKARYSTHKIVGDTDSVVVDLGTWLGYCRAGVPQALEAMFSQMPIHDDLQALRSDFRIYDSAVERYLRVMRAFTYKQTFKHKRHALRLAINLNDLRRQGRFNPTLQASQIEFVNDVAQKDSDVVEAWTHNIALDRFCPKW